MGHLDVGADEPRGGQPTVVTGQHEGQEGGVEVEDCREGVERGLRQCTLRTGARRRGALAGHGRDELHEQLRQLHVVQRVVGAQGRDLVLGRVVAPTGSDDVDRERQRFVDPPAVVQVAGQVRDRRFARLRDVGANLQVARVTRAHPVNETRIGTGDNVLRFLGRIGVGEIRQGLAHRLGELREGHHVVSHCSDVIAGQRLIVRDEQVALAHVALGLGVIATVNGVVRTLEEERLAVGDDLARQALWTGDHARRGDDGSRHVVLGLDLDGRGVVVAQGEQTPGTVGLETDASHAHQDLLTVEAHHVAVAAVRRRNREVGAPVVTPFGLVIALDGEDEFLAERRDGVDPVVVPVGEI